MTAGRQVVELLEKYDREIERSSKLQGDISALKAKVHEAQVATQKAEDSAQAYYDQYFDEAANSLKSQLSEKCNKYFIQGWRVALNRAGVNDASELYDFGPKRLPFKPASPEEHEEEGATEGQIDPNADDDQIPIVEVQEGEGDSDGADAVNVVD